MLTGLFALFFSTSCKKVIEKKVQDMVMDAITHGEWIVEQYHEGDNNLSNQFLNYSFKFNSNGTLKSTVNGTVTDGTWAPNTSNYTINADFPTAVDPLKKLNGTWKIKDSNWEYVKAEMPTDDGRKLLTLRKK